ncbi:FUT13 (predicted) [Pycnogonum litorale]
MRSIFKMLQCLLISGLLTTIYYEIFCNRLHKISTKTIDRKSIPNGRNRKLIYLWMSHKDYHVLGIHKYRIILHNRGCAVTDDVNDLYFSDAVLVKGDNVGNVSELLFSARSRLRNVRQKWILLSINPIGFGSTSVPLEQFDGIFNWTMTYRSGSDFTVNHGSIVNGSSQVNKDPRNLQVAAWMPSICKSGSRTEILIERLKKFEVEIETIGDDGTDCYYNSKQHCFRWIAGNYRFYLAFEDHICKDYVPEDIYYCLEYGVVPVVMGGGGGGIDYSRILIPGSYVDVADFVSVETLAKYLLDVNDDRARYREFFKWRQRCRIEHRDGLKFALIEMCRNLNKVTSTSAGSDVNATALFDCDFNGKKWSRFLKL